MTDRLPVEAEMAWDEFHRTVNMTAQELRAWLLTDASGEAAFTAGPDMDLSAWGHHVVRILGKRKVDLTDVDVDTMRGVIDFVAERLADEPPGGAGDQAWRRSLMTVGHDPLRSA